VRFFSIIPLGALLALSSCGYTLQTSRSQLVDKEGIRRIYVSPLVNNTYKVGVENIVYNELLRKLAQHRMVQLVQSQADADAVVDGIVYNASYVESGRTNFGSRTIASQYRAILGVNFVLRRAKHEPGKKMQIWSGSVAREGRFASAFQAGVRGETTALINESEFERTLGDLARGMMSEVHESMLAMF
jgi:hypothetical protein